jgi:uncharacterized protein
MVASAIVPSPILDALYHGRRDEADRLLAESSPDTLTIHEAAAMGVVSRLADLLRQDPAAVNAWASDGFQPLGLACFFGRPEAVALLLASGGEVNTPSRNSFGVTALHAALAGPTPEIARSLIEAGAEVNAVQQDGVTPLQEAAANGNLELVQLLLERGANPSTRDAKQRTAADFARARGHAEIVAFLES